MPDYIADTNVYVTAAREAAFQYRFEHFIASQGPLRVSAVVVAELLIGLPDRRQHASAVRALSEGASLEAPSVDDWIAAAGAIAALGGEVVTKGRSFWNDALLAAQCARLDATLVTANAEDFRRLERHLSVRIAAPFPVRAP